MPNARNSKTPSAAQRLRRADLRQRGVRALSFAPDAEASAQIAKTLDLIALSDAQLTGRLTPVGREDWDLEARITATVVQPCVVTLAPVTSHVQDDVLRRFRIDAAMPDDGGEHEMPEDDSIDPMPEVIDLADILTEALALALPLYPRAGDAEAGEAIFTEPGKAPLTDADMKPLAGLADLKRRMETGEDPDHD